jgi:hypothetical protein
MNEAGADVGFWLDEDHGKKLGEKKQHFKRRSGYSTPRCCLHHWCGKPVIVQLAFLKSIPYSVAENLSELSTHKRFKIKAGITGWFNSVVKRR